MAKISKWLSVAAAVSLTLGAPILAAPVLAAPMTAEEANRADAQCMSLMILATGQDNMNAMDRDTLAGTMLIMGYYVGRIEMRTPDIDMGALTKDVVANDMTNPELLNTISGRCLLEIESLTELLSTAKSGLK